MMRVSLLAIVLCLTSLYPLHASFRCAGYAPAPQPEAAGKILAAARSAHGSVRALVLFAGFRDEVARLPNPPAFARDLFDPELPGSLSHFYHLMSHGQLQLSGAVAPVRYAAAGPAADYLSAAPGVDGDYGRYALEVLRRADREIDFGLYDNDGPDGRPNSGDDDGVVDYIFIVPLTTPRGFIRGGAEGIAGLGFGGPTGSYETDDRASNGQRIRILSSNAHGSLQRQGNFAQTVGVMAHEFGHAFGLPDLYDTDFGDPVSDSAGIGGWGLMGRGAHGWSGHDGPAPFSAWSLERLGWLGRGNRQLVEVLGGRAGALARDVFQGGSVYKVYLPPEVPRTAASRRDDWQGPVDQGYLLLEQRVRGAHYYNRDLPGEGLLVWHVRPLAYTNGDEAYKVVDLVCADGLYLDAGFPAGRQANAERGRDNLDFWAHDLDYARSRGGNLGDATDPFDGVRYTRLGVEGNPAAASVGVYPTDGLVPLAIRMRKQGEAMLLDIEPPRWRGTIRREALWTGTILVDGDLEIAPGAEVYIKRGTRVLFAGRDALETGLDPERVELRVGGAVELVTQFSRGGPVVLTGARPEDRWYGVVMDEGGGGRIDAAAGHLQLRQAVRGVVLPGAPEGAEGLGLAAAVLRDGPGGLTAGNGDGKLQPGESFALELALGNWSLERLKDLEISLEWGDAPVRTTWGAGGATSVSYREKIGLSPGQSERIRLPALTLDGGVQPGERVGFALRVRGGGQDLHHRLAFDVAEGAEPAAAVLTLPDHPILGGSALASPARPLAVRVEVRRGRAQTAQAVLRHVDSGEIVAEASLQRLGASFVGQVRPAQAGRYALHVRVRDESGAVHFAGERVRVPALSPAWGEVLVVRREARWGGSDINEALAEAATREGLTASFIDLNDPAERAALLHDGVLAHYQAPGRAVVWLADPLAGDEQQALARYLDGGGRLLMSGLNMQSRLGPALYERLHIRNMRYSALSELKGADFAFSVSYRRLEGMQAPAEPFVRSITGMVAGLKLDTGVYRLVLAPFNLTSVIQTSAEDFARLMRESLGYLLVEAPQAALRIERVLGVRAQQGIEALRPGLMLLNPGAQPARGWKAGYQIWQDERLVGDYEIEVPAVAAGGRRPLLLPRWAPPTEGDYALRFSLHGPGGRAFEPLRPLQVADVRGQFAREALPLAEQGNGAGFFDYDGDGDLDLYLVRLGAANALYRNARGRLEEVAAEAGIADRGVGRGLAVGDYDGDGDLDLYVVNEGGNRLFANEAGGFRDVTRAQGVGDGAAGRSAGFFDYDADGDLDLYVVSEGANVLYDNAGPRFRERAAEVGLADRGRGRGLAVGDYDGDGDVDVFVTNQFGAIESELYENEGGRFAGVARVRGLTASRREVAAVFGDYDDDGDLDLFLSNEAGANALWRNERGYRFRRAEHALGSRSAGAAFFDYDNDGDLDLVTAAVDSAGGGDQIFHNRGAAGFAPVGSRLGLGRTAQGRGVAFGDYDGDGRQDVLVAGYGGSQLYRNRVSSAGWLAVDLQGAAGNPDGLGARVVLNAAGQRQVRELQSSYGYGSQAQPWVHFGLGSVERVDSLRVFWPDGRQSLAVGVRTNQRLVLAHPLAGLAAKAAESAVTALGAGYPNPFNAEVVIPLRLAAAEGVQLVVYNALGQAVRRLVDGPLAAGDHRVAWDGRDEQGRAVASGIYVYRLRAGGHGESRRLVLVR